MKAAKIISISLAALLILASLFASTYWLVFAAPILVLTVCQSVAIYSDIRYAEWFFGYTDLAYYLIVGAVIGIGTVYLPELDRVFRDDAELTFAKAEVELPQAQETARTATQERIKTSASLESIPVEILGECFARQLTADLQNSVEDDPQVDRPALLLPDYPPGCEIPLSVVDLAARTTGEAIIANDRVTELEEIVERGPEPTLSSSDFLSAEELERILFRLFPALILCGVMLKVGKSTLAIRKNA